MVVIQAAISCEFLSFAFYSIQICFAAGFHEGSRRIRDCSSCDVPSSFLLKFKNLYGWSYIVNRSKAGFKAIKRSADTLARFNGFNVFGMEKGHFACHLKTMSSVVMQNDLFCNNHQKAFICLGLRCHRKLRVICTCCTMSNSYCNTCRIGSIYLRLNLEHIFTIGFYCRIFA